MPYRKAPNISGFTLVELLVTITIIAILAAIGLVTYSVALKQGRDSKRQSDLRAIQSALEQYNSDQLFYPYASGNNPPGLDDRLLSGSQFNSNIGNPPSNTRPSPAKIYMNAVPRDPTNLTAIPGRYRYQAIPTLCNNDPPPAGIKCTNYCLYALLENSPSPVPAPPTGCSFTGSYAGYNFAVSLP